MQAMEDYITAVSGLSAARPRPVSGPSAAWDGLHTRLDLAADNQLLQRDRWMDGVAKSILNVQRVQQPPLTVTHLAVLCFPHTHPVLLII